MISRGPYRRHSTPFKVQLCQDIRAGVIGRRNAQRTHRISANLIQLWLTQLDRGELTDEEAEASVIAEYEARIAALERKVGQLPMELDLVKKTPRVPGGASSERSFIVTRSHPDCRAARSTEAATTALLCAPARLSNRGASSTPSWIATRMWPR